MKHLVEVGCSGKSSLHNLFDCASLVEIFEPLPHHLDRIHHLYGGNDRVKIHPYALWKDNCSVKMYDLGETSYIEGVVSPVVANYNYCPKQENELFVEARTFDEFDDGTIDILDIDAEGSEWHVIEKMKSRPEMIIIEMSWLEYKNPYFDQIQSWMLSNNYAEINRKKANVFYQKLT